ncbi:MAG: D-2-hydroxyacid dehydrogenase [Defluviitaleaceae bacterium]|nr:D-2-hydroxyacid dehydrogenase [Defluviitaleaceae bacterium]
MKIVVLDGYTLNPGDLSWDGFEKLGTLIVHDRTSADKVAERIGDAEVVITNKTPVTKESIDACPNIKYIGVLATGYNVVDIDAAKAKGIPVSNIPTYGTMAVAQFVMALLLEICHNVGAHSRAVHEGRWVSSEDFCFWDYPLMEISGKTIGLIGFGRIGQATGKAAAALGMNVIACDEYESEEGRKIGQYVTMDELLAKADVISLHAPLLPSTQGLINKDTIAKMKDGAILINTARGPIINEQDVADALNSGKLYAAGLDVVSIEPIKADNPLLKAKNCYITPHIAWAPTEARTRLMDIAVDNLKAFMDGKVANVVNG